MTRILSLVSLATLTASMAFAQGAVVCPIGAATADGNGTSQNYFRELASRWQSVYDTSVFTGQVQFSPIEINTVSFRPTAGTVNPAVPYAYANAEVYVQYAATDHAAMATQFALNRTIAQPSTPNFLGTITVNTPTGATPVNSDDVVINLTTPFIFDPSLGQDLLVEIFLPAVPSPVPVLATDVPVRTCASGVAAYKMGTCRVVGAASTTATGGTLTGFTPVTKFDYTVPAGVAKHDPYGTGCYTIARSFYEVFPGNFPNSTNDLSGNTVTAAPAGNGGYLVVTVPGATVVPPTTTGLALGDDQVYATPITLPFTFDYMGGSTTTIWVDSNGSIALGGAAAPASVNTSSSVNTLLAADRPRIAASLQDLLPDGATNVDNVFAEVDPNNPGVFLITWVNVPCFLTTPNPASGRSTFQIALIDNAGADTFEIRFQSLANDSDSYGGAAITGFSTGGTSLDGGSRDLTGAPFVTAPDLGALELRGSPRPVMGTPVTYQVNNIRPGGFTLMQAGFIQDLTGTPLSAYGLNAPGCSAFLAPVGLSSFGPLLFGSPSDSFSFTWPNGYPGVRLFVQAFELQSVNPENPAGLLVSNGLEVLLGTL